MSYLPGTTPCSRSRSTVPTWSFGRWPLRRSTGPTRAACSAAPVYPAFQKPAPKEPTVA